MKLDYSLITDIEIDGINYSDAHDFCDAFICYANYGDREMTQSEIDELNENRDFVYEQVLKKIY
jgi:hypothetical protein